VTGGKPLLPPHTCIVYCVPRYRLADSSVSTVSTSLNSAQHCSTVLNIAQHCSTLLNIAQHRSTLLNIAQHRSTLLNFAPLTLLNQSSCEQPSCDRRTSGFCRQPAEPQSVTSVPVGLTAASCLSVLFLPCLFLCFVNCSCAHTGCV
jgi:hypothetical protein